MRFGFYLLVVARCYWTMNRCRHIPKKTPKKQPSDVLAAFEELHVNAFYIRTRAAATALDVFVIAPAVLEQRQEMVALNFLRAHLQTFLSSRVDFSCLGGASAAFKEVNSPVSCWGAAV